MGELSKCNADSLFYPRMKDLSPVRANFRINHISTSGYTKLRGIESEVQITSTLFSLFLLYNVIFLQVDVEL